jgi:preprotein translocase subunit SecG
LSRGRLNGGAVAIGDSMTTVLLVLHLFVGAGLIALVLLQHGKGADMGAAFGSGASSTVFGARGSANFLSRTTAILATIFFATSLTLAIFAGRGQAPRSVIDAQPAAPATAPEGPVAPAEPPAPAEPAPAPPPAAPAE